MSSGTESVLPQENLGCLEVHSGALWGCSFVHAHNTQSFTHFTRIDMKRLSLISISSPTLIFLYTVPYYQKLEAGKVWEWGHKSLESLHILVMYERWSTNQLVTNNSDVVSMKMWYGHTQDKPNIQVNTTSHILTPSTKRKKVSATYDICALQSITNTILTNTPPHLWLLLHTSSCL